MPVRFSTDKHHKPNRISSFLGGVICLILSLTGFYATFSAGPITGGLPFLPDVMNSMIGRIFFGLGALITGCLAVYAFYEFFGKRTSSKP